MKFTKKQRVGNENGWLVEIEAELKEPGGDRRDTVKLAGTGTTLIMAQSHALRILAELLGEAKMVLDLPESEGPR